MFAISSSTTTSTTTEEGETTEYDIITSIHEMASCILCLPHM
jgi:hypothetical protein